MPGSVEPESLTETDTSPADTRESFWNELTDEKSGVLSSNGVDILPLKGRNIASASTAGAAQAVSTGEPE